MTSYPVDIRRCGHIRTNGTQCGSPALKAKELCFYHDQNRPRSVELYVEGERYVDGTIVIPPFEDAHSIQTTIRHVVQLLMERRMDRKDAGLALYALQIASGNLKMMLAEKAKPTQVVVEPEKTAETPLGMTPWSASGEGYDPEEDEEEEEWDDSEPQPDPPPLTPEELSKLLPYDDRKALMRKWREEGLITNQEIEDYILGGPDPLVLCAHRLIAEREQHDAERETARRRAEAGRAEPENVELRNVEPENPVAPVGDDDAAREAEGTSCL